MKKIEVSAKTIDKAIEEGLSQLGASIDEVEVNILSEGGFFKKAKVEITLIEKEKPAKKDLSNVEFTDEELAFMGETKPVEEKPKKEPKKAVKEESKTEPEKEVEEIKPIKNREERRKEKEIAAQDLIPTVEKIGKEFLEGFIKTLNLEANVNTNSLGESIEFAVDGSNMGTLIGYRGASLEALQYLLNIVIGNKTAYKKRVYLNIENYRQKREETLKSMADRIAKKVLDSKRRCKLEPMSSFERRIIHTHLNGKEHITTRSEGTEPNRYLIIEYVD